MEWIELGKILEFQKKSKIKAGDGQPIGKYAMYTSSMILDKYLDEYQYDKEALIMGTGGKANIHYSTGQFNTSTDCYVLYKKTENILLKYIYSFLFGNIHILEEGFRGAGLKHINQKYVKEIKIPVPSMEIQEKIVEVLDGAQALIDKRKEQIQLLDRLIESTFYTMFGDPVKNEKGWDVEKLKTTTEIITGNTPPRKDPQNYGDYIEWIKSDNINTPYTIVTKAKEYLSEIGKKRARYVPKNSILMTCIAGSLSCIGNVAITDREVAYNQQINGFIPKKYSLYFLYNLFCLSKEFIQNKSTSSMKGMISKGVLSELEFIVPPLTLQNEFADKVEVIEKQKKLLEKSLELLEENYKSIMDKAFKGQLWKV